MVSVDAVLIVTLSITVPIDSSPFEPVNKNKTSGRGGGPGVGVGVGVLGGVGVGVGAGVGVGLGGGVTDILTSTGAMVFEVDPFPSWP